MRFNELELKKTFRKHSGNELKNLTPEEEISINILNFIHAIHLNRQDFYNSLFATKYYGDLEMAFNKESGCLIGHCRAIVKNENRVIDYLFTENGYELLSDVVK
jgi:hypothetical protein